MTDTVFFNKLKMYFSSLFARTMPKAILGIPVDGYAPGVFLFTNIPPEEMEFYEPSPEYWLHHVRILDTEFLDDLYKRFPCLRSVTACLDTNALLSVVNKRSGDESVTVDVGADKRLYVSTTQKNGAPLVLACGDLLTDYTACRYHDLYEHRLVDPTGATVISLKDRDDPPGVPYVIVDLPPVGGRPAKCVVVTNKSTVSVKEFVKKSGFETYAHDLIAIPDRLTIRVNVRFTCPAIEVVSVQPAIAWITKHP